MARDEKGADKAKSGKDDDYEFIPPDFDEDAFIHREMVSFRTTTILFLWGILAALISWGLFHAVDGAKVGWLIGLLVAAVFGFALKWLYPRLKADIKHFGRREWLGTGFLFFFTWLSFFLIAINPPLSDFAAPRVDLHAAPLIQQEGDDVVVYAFFEDNDRVASHAVTIHGPDGEVAATEEDLGRGKSRIVAPGLPPGLYTIDATATDRQGHSENANLTFSVVETVLDVQFPDGTSLDSAGDRVLVTIGGSLVPCTKKLREDCIRTVYLDLGNSTRVTLEHDAQVGGWLAYPNHAGWRSGAVRFDVVAEFVDDYIGSGPVDGGDLREGPFQVNVTAPLGEYAPKVFNNPGAPQRNVPGIGLPLLLVGLVGLVALARRRAA